MQLELEAEALLGAPVAATLSLVYSRSRQHVALCHCNADFVFIYKPHLHFRLIPIYRSCRM